MLRLLGFVLALFLVPFNAWTLVDTAAFLDEYQYEGPKTVRKLVEAGAEIGGVDLERKRVVVVRPPTETFVRRVDGVTLVETRRQETAVDTRWLTHDKVNAELCQLDAKAPHLVRVHEIGKSLQGRSIFAVQLGNRSISDKTVDFMAHHIATQLEAKRPGALDYEVRQQLLKPKDRKPAVLFDALHHAREVMTPEIAMDLIRYYVDQVQAKNPDFVKYSERLDVWVVPMLNPDGSAKVFAGQNMWRKNARGGYGVDINRNYRQDFARCRGSSSDPGSETFRGSGPESEPETQAIVKLALQIQPLIYLSWHTFSEIVIYPPGCSPNQLPGQDGENTRKFGRELAAKLLRDSGRGTYQAGTSYELLYNTDGASIDTVQALTGAWSYVVEANSSGAGFQPPYSMRDDTVRRQRPGWKLVLDRALQRAAQL